MKGKITTKSKLNEGTEFIIELPLELPSVDSNLTINQEIQNEFKHF